MPPKPTDKAAALRTMRIIAGALIVGVASFGAIAAFIGLGGQTAQDTDPLLAYVAVAAAFMAVIIWAMVPASLGARPRGADDEADDRSAEDRELELYAAYQTKMIVRYAMLEGAAFFNLVAVIIDHQWWNLAVAGALVVLLLTAFPTSGRVERFVRVQGELGQMRR